MSRLTAFAVFVLVFTLGGCCLFDRKDSPPPEAIRKSLEDVVDAVQFAVDTAADQIEKEGLWLATDQEIKHWTEACNGAKKDAVVACRPVLEQASILCAEGCPSGRCGPAHDEICRRFVAGEDRAALCVNPPAVRGPWCAGVGACAQAKELRDGLCEGASSLRKPELKRANLSVAVEETESKSGKLNVILLSAGGTSASVGTNTVNVVLTPRVRSSDYGSSAITKIPTEERSISSDAETLAGNLAELIANSIRSNVKEYRLTQAAAGAAAGAANAKATAARPPMAMSDLTVTFELAIEEGGTIGLKKEWTLPAGIELSSEHGNKRTNSLSITYGRPE